jgi:serine/threonine protein kinase
MITRTKWQQILHEKNLVLPVFEETNWSGRGQHVESGPGEGPTIDNLLVPEGVLGHSATALVEKVRCKRIMLARKKIQCNWRLKREDAIEEVAHLQRLSHAHVIRGVGTYVFGKELSILLYPATEYNMETFMDQFSDRTAHFSSIHADFRTYFCMQNAICKFFKCLVNTVSFIHNNLVKHMDIKPTNLLIQEKTHSDEIHYKVYLADFGIARSYNSIADVETESLTLFSRTYAAPEVIRQDKRGFPADIFSLGCVFLEMLAVLEDQRHALIDIRRRNPGGDLSYQANLPALWPLNLLNGKIVGKYDSGFSDQIGGAIKSMLEYHPDLRPTALQLYSIFVDNTGCCSTGPEPFEVAVSLKTDTHIMEALPE